MPSTCYSLPTCTAAWAEGAATTEPATEQAAPHSSSSRPPADIIFVIDQEVNSMGREPRVWVLRLFTISTRWPFSFEHSHGMSPAREALGAGGTGEACVW